MKSTLLPKQSGSTWQNGVTLPHFPTLSSDEQAEVVIVGGGLAGLLSAYVLARTGKSVILLEKGRILEGTTAYTTAFITQFIDTYVSDMVQQFGDEKTKLIWRSHGQAISLIAQIVQKEKIACEFKRRSYTLYARSSDESKELQQEYAIMHRLGFAVKLHHSLTTGFENNGALEITNQASFHPLLFAAGLLPSLQRLGVKIYENSTVQDSTSANATTTVKTADHQVSAAYAITATYDPLQNPLQTFGKKGMYVSYVYELRIPKGAITEGMYEDLANPYHYFRIDAGVKFDRMIVGGEDNRQEIAVLEDRNWQALDTFTQQLLGETPYVIIRRWSGPILEASDGLALIGEYAPHRLLATAFSGNGMTYAGITALLFRDYISGKSNPFFEVYDPKRALTPRTVGVKIRDFTGEFFGAAVKNVRYLFKK